ncbi:hypothetical protein OIU79_011525 [Salix purpurea]|uniref:Uncharacterized protein n=1 Tax=Salix purpurea TaxID=77065 RepID=A0A9Q0Q119_SALPP|nr:hypothetical protein OIU79_011525 [Salix purpurea]
MESLSLPLPPHCPSLFLTLLVEPTHPHERDRRSPLTGDLQPQLRKEICTPALGLEMKIFSRFQVIDSHGKMFVRKLVSVSIWKISCGFLFPMPGDPQMGTEQKTLEAVIRSGDVENARSSSPKKIPEIR